MVVFGFAFYRGGFRALDTKVGKIRDFSLPAAGRDTLDALLASTQQPILTLDLRNALRDPDARGWFRFGHDTHCIGSLSLSVWPTTSTRSLGWASKVASARPMMDSPPAPRVLSPLGGPLSVDLFITRPERPLSWPEVRVALDAVLAKHPDLSCFIVEPSVEADNLYFWHVLRVNLSLIRPEEDGDEAEPMLRQPYLVLTSSSSSWPWVEFAAFALAALLGGEIYDPQEGAARAIASNFHGPRALS